MEFVFLGAVQEGQRYPQQAHSAEVRDVGRSGQGFGGLAAQCSYEGYRYGIRKGEIRFVNFQSLAIPNQM